MNLGENIKKVRKERGLTQTQLAQMIHAHLSHLSRVETGKYVPGIDTIIKIAKALDVSVDYLISDGNEDLEEVQIEDKSLSERIKLLNTLDDDERLVVNKVIDALLTKKKMINLLHEVTG